MSLGKNKILHQAGAVSYDDIIDIDNFNITTEATWDPNDMGIYTAGGGEFGDSGNKFYGFYEYPNGIVYEYNTPSAYNFPASTTNSVRSLNLDGLYGYNIEIISGTKFFFLERMTSGSTWQWNEYTLSTAWNISTLSRNTSNYYLTEDVSAKISGYNHRLSQCFNSDGTSLYCLFITTSYVKIARFDLSTPYDVSGVGSASIDSESPALATGQTVTGQRGLYINDSETQIIASLQNNRVMQIDMTTASDLTTATVTKTRNFGNAQSYHFKYYPDAQKALMAGDSSGYYSLFTYVP